VASAKSLVGGVDDFWHPTGGVTGQRMRADEERVVPLVKRVDRQECGSLSGPDLHDISRTSNGVLATMAPRAQQVQSYVTDNKIYCVYIADDEETVREHAHQGGFPADTVSMVHSIIDPTTGEAE
jgi:Protein of unknown function (DUF4242)